MANWLPTKWRETLAQLRSDIQEAISRWVRKQEERKAPPTAEDTIAPWMSWDWPAPAIEVDETAEAVAVTAELPGMSKDDFQLEVMGDTLVIRGEKKREREERHEGYWYSECAYGAFSRWIPLPAEVVAEKAEAKFRNGRLYVRLPKRTPAKKIPVQVSSQ